MKSYIYYTAFFLFLTACKAQSPIYDISDLRDGPKNSYYKDINNVLDGYDGTYLYKNGSTSLKFILNKNLSIEL